MNKSKVSAIIPAFNEEKNIAQVLTVISQSPLIEEIIVVNDGSTDKTAHIVKQFSSKIKIINLTKNQGKAMALTAGAQKASCQILFFCDADLINLKQVHLEQLIKPVVSGKFRLIVGAQEFMRGYGKKKTGSKQSEIQKTLGGEKVLWKEDFFKIDINPNSHYRLEQVILNYYLKNHLSYRLVTLQGVSHPHKVKKWGWFKGLQKDLPTYLQFGLGYLKYRCLKIKRPFKS